MQPAATSLPLTAPAPARPAVRRAPGPRGHRLLGSLMDVRGDRLRFVLRSMREYGDLVAFRMGPKRLFLLSHPDSFRHVLCERPERYAKGVGLVEARPLLGDGLLTSEGALAAEQRRRLQGGFHPRHLPDFAAAMSTATQAMVQRWQQAGIPDSGRTVDVAREMVVLTLDVLGATLLGADLKPRAEQISRDLTELTHWAMARMTAVVRLSPALPTPANLRARRALRRLEEVARDILRQRQERREGQEDDFLGRLLAQSEHGEEESRQKEVRDQLLTFLLAGHETTAAALAWAWYLLARHPQVEARLHEELDTALGEAPPDLDDLPRLPYTRAVVDETLRLYPPVWMIPRQALEDDEVGGYRLDAGADVLLSVYSLHRHPAFWPEPERFRPERFLAGAERRPPYAYLPFGAGPRSCIGSRFSLMEMVLAVATVARQFRLERPSGSGDVEAEPSLTLHPRQAMPLRPVRRASRIPAKRAETPLPNRPSSNRPSSNRAVCPFHAQAAT